MALASRWQDRNLSKIELVVAIMLISIFIGAFAFRALKIFALTEQTTVTLTINNMNTALKYKALIALSNNNAEQLGDLVNINPMQLVSAGQESFEKSREELVTEAASSPTNAPVNYVGELYNADINDIEPGKWYFDRSSNLLIYRVKNTEFFYTRQEGPESIRFAVKFDYVDVDNNNVFDPDIDKFVNIKIESVDYYEWNI